MADAEAARLADVAKAAEKKAEKAAAPTAPAPAKATAGKGDVTGKYAEPAREAAAIKAKEAEKRPFPVVPLAVGAVAVSLAAPPVRAAVGPAVAAVGAKAGPAPRPSRAASRPAPAPSLAA